MKLHGRLRTASEVNAAERAAMLRLMDRHYANLTPDNFAADLAEKQWVIQVLDDAGEICGFSTQMVLDIEVDGRSIQALFSGDTIVDQEHWGSRALLQTWRDLALSLIARRPDGELYWFLICQGYKTYRFLPLFFQQYFPAFDRATTPEIRRLIDALSRAKYPHTYDAGRGIVPAHPGQYRLREGVADATLERCRDEHVRFFVERNPGHVHGDELCCVARLHPSNFTAAARRILEWPS